MHDQASPAELTATDLLAQITEMRGMIQAVNGSAPACPPWCECKADHADEQVHVGTYRIVDLSLAELHPTDDLAPDLYVRLERGFRSATETSIAMVCKDRYDIELTVAEAADLIGALADCIRQATGQQ
jgi:hypothetical protein